MIRRRTPLLAPPRRTDGRKRLLDVDALGLCALLVSGMLILSTALTFADPNMRPVFGGAGLALVIESFCATVGFGVFYVGLARFISHGRYSELCVSLAFFAFSSAGLLYGTALPLALPDRPQAPELEVYGTLCTRLLGGLLLALSYFLADYRATRQQRTWRALLAIAILAEAVMAVGVGLYLVRDRLTPLAAASVRTGISGLSSIETSWALAMVLLYLAGAYAYYRSYRQSHDAVTGCLALGLIIASFSELHLMAYPLSYRATVTNGDLVRLVFYLVLLVGLSVEYMQSFLRLQAQHDELAALYRVATVPIASRDLSGAMAEICSTICASLQAERAAALLYDAEADALEVLPPPSQAHAPARLSPAQAGPAMTVIREAVAVRCPGGPQDAWLAPALGVSAVRHALLVPLRSEASCLGALAAANRKEGGFGPEEERLLSVMAVRTAMVIENTRLYDHVEAAAALGERAHLAREVHDGLAQSLSYLNLKLAKLLSYDSLPEPLSQELQEVKQASEASLAEARQSIAALRLGPTDEGRFMDTLQRYVEEFAEENGLAVSLVKGAGLPPTSPQVRAELLRIVQEALNNVRKHAQASSVRVVLTASPKGIGVRIQDDGQGFAYDETRLAEDRHFGLVGMRERAFCLGGELRVHSEPGKGTVVEVEVPAWTRREQCGQRE